MGKRSRKRGGGDGAEATPESASAATTRAERDAARRRRAAASSSPSQSTTRRSDRRGRAGRSSIDERPPAPWGNFPLVELVVLIALVLLISSLFVKGNRGATMLIAGLALGSLAGLELTIREHFAGYRSHSALLAGAVGLLSLGVTYLIVGGTGALIMLPVAALTFGLAFYGFREAFKRRTGGVAFRR